MIKNKSTLIIPAAGIKKFDKIPYIFEKTPNGCILLIESINRLPLNNFSRIIVAIQETIEKIYHIKELILSEIASLNYNGQFEVLILKKDTKNEPETVTEVIKEYGVKGPILVKDADNFFTSDFINGNGVCVYSLDKLEYVSPASKSYVEIDDYQYISNIIEKKIISRYFCTGGYFFENAEKFIEYCNQANSNSDLYMSHIIFLMLLDKNMFRPIFVKKFIDLGTYKDWINYKRQFKTLYIAADIAMKNANKLNDLISTNNYKLIITSNSKNQEIITRKLNNVGIKYHSIITNIYMEQQFIITDETQLVNI